MTSYNWQGGNFYAEFSTSSDPAVVAAQKAENAAQLAKVAAENSVQYSLDSKRASESVFSEVTNSQYGLSALRHEILLNRPAPIINHLKGLNYATATKTSTFILDTSVSNATHYRFNNGDWQEYAQDQLTVNNIAKGVNRIEVEFGNFPLIVGEGNTAKSILTIFGL